jgi:hypothetical protein
MRKPYYVCGGLQDNGSWCGPSQTPRGGAIINSDWYRIGGGDGFYVKIDPTDHNTVYVESQDGNVNRLDLKTGRNVSIRPRGPGQRQGGGADESGAAQPQQGGGQQQQRSNVVPPTPAGEQFRFYWNTPIHISPHNPRTVYVAANRVFKSVDRGETWAASPDLTKNVDRTKLPVMGIAGDKPMASKHDGTGNYSNVITVAESPAQAGVIWAGTNDGNIQVSRDGGANWTNVSKNVPGIPELSKIARVEPSHFEAGTCYITVDAHRLDDFKPYVFVTRDFGASWQSISNNLPTGNANVIREDQVSQPALPWHRVRFLHLAQWRERMEAVYDGAAHGED